MNEKRFLKSLIKSFSAWFCAQTTLIKEWKKKKKKKRNISAEENFSCLNELWLQSAETRLEKMLQ